MAYTVTNCLGVLKELFFPTEPKYKELTFTQETYAKLMCYIHLIGDYEITGFGRVVDNKIIDVKILRQTVKSATVDCDVDAMNEFLMAIPKDQIGQWILDWHSHVNMGVFASGTDSSNYEQQWKARLNNQFPLIIVNKSQQIYSKCYISPSRQTDLKIKVETEGLTKDRLIEIYNECTNDIETQCSKNQVTYQQTTWYQGNNYYNKYYKNDDYDDYDQSYSYTGTKVDLTNNKKKGLAKVVNIKNTQNKENLDSSKEDNDDVCWSCGQFLWSALEYDRGICDDCWELMPLEDRRQWLEAIRECK